MTTPIEDYIKEVEADIANCIESLTQQHIIDMDELDGIYISMP